MRARDQESESVFRLQVYACASSLVRSVSGEECTVFTVPLFIKSFCSNVLNDEIREPRLSPQGPDR